MARSLSLTGLPENIWNYPISDNARALWAVIKKFGGTTEEGCAVTNLQLSNELDVLPRTISAALIELRKAQLVRDNGTKGGRRRLFNVKP